MTKLDKVIEGLSRKKEVRAQIAATILASIIRSSVNLPNAQLASETAIKYTDALLLELEK